MSLFSRRDRHIYKSGSSWKVSRFSLTPDLLETAFSAKSQKFFGAFWSNETEYAVIDIDSKSQYHSPIEAKRLLEDLASVGLQNSLLFQSSESKGWHIYFPFHSKVCSVEVEAYLKRFLRLSGYSIKCGQLEVFPSGNALRLPLQRQFGWLNYKFELIAIRDEMSTQEAVARFLDEFEKSKNDWHSIKNILDALFEQREETVSTEGFDKLFGYRIIRENYEKGRAFWQTGLTEKNQRHEAILCVEHYLWHGDPVIGLPARPGRFNDDTRYDLILSWIKEKHNGYSGHVSAGNWHSIHLDIERAVRWRSAGRKKLHEAYPCTERALEVLEARARRTGRVWTMEDLKKGNDRREAEARQKIRKSVASMRLAGEQLSRNAIARASGCSPNTVSKHADLWRCHLASGSCDLSRGDGVSSKDLVVPVSEAQDFGFIAVPFYRFHIQSSLPAGVVELFGSPYRLLADAGGTS